MFGPHIIGSETEYGIVAVDDPTASPIHTSTQAVVAYAEHSGQGVNRRTRWDYENESPLRDIRGFDLRRYRRGSAPVLDPNALGAANVITANGARFYVDHAHPEYSSPESATAYDAVVWDKAGDIIMHRAAEAAEPELKIYKNNVDGKGASYGSHENYLYPRDLDVEDVQAALIPHFVTRQVFCGAGRIGLGQQGEQPGFQISQRADYIETEISLETTLNRGIVNTRDEPHADADKWRRLHVIIGDANLSEFSNYLKFGTTALVLAAVAQGAYFGDLRLLEPVSDVQRVSRDLDCTARLRFYGQAERTAIETQREIRKRVGEIMDLRGDDLEVYELWGQILDDLQADPLSTADRLDWTAKLQLINAYRARGLEWTDPRLALVDLQYSDIDPRRGLYHALVKKGRMRTFIDPAEVTSAVDTPPASTRAWLRGHLVANYSADILSANWDNVIVDTPDGAVQITMDDPRGFNQLELRTLLESGTRPGISELVAGLKEINPEKVSGVGRKEV